MVVDLKIILKQDDFKRSTSGLTADVRKNFASPIINSPIVIKDQESLLNNQDLALASEPKEKVVVFKPVERLDSSKGVIHPKVKLVNLSPQTRDSGLLAQKTLRPEMKAPKPFKEKLKRNKEKDTLSLSPLQVKMQKLKTTVNFKANDSLRKEVDVTKGIWVF